MNYLVAVFGIMACLISTILFKYAAGSLSIKKINVISFTYYNLMVFTVIGSLIILFGFRDHYMVGKINDTQVVLKTWLFLAYTMIMLPLAIILFTKIFTRGKYLTRYEEYIEQQICYENTETVAWKLAVGATIVGVITTGYMFLVMGEIPLLTVLKLKSIPATLRIDAAQGYAGNKIIRNVVVLMLTPLISYLSYIYMRVSKTRKIRWTVLFIIDAILAILIKTYNLEKAPVIYWLLYFYIIEILLGKTNIIKTIRLIGISSALLIGGMYLFAGYEGSFFSLSSGPLSRLFITQASTLFLHVQSFPNYHTFLYGASLPTAVSWIFWIF